jgi:hypothetical protein
MFPPDIVTVPVTEFAAMLSAQWIFPHAIYGYYESYGINFDTLDRILLDIFLILN